MKSLHLLLGATILALAALTACQNDEPQQEEQTTYDDSYYAELASIGSSDANFTATDGGGSIYFKTEGGSVVVTVDCGCDWTVENNVSDLFTSTITNSTTLTISAAQNYVENDLTGTITLFTSFARISFATITVTQAAYGAPEITVETNEVNFAAAGELTAELAVEATADWTAESADAWLTVEKSGDGITLTVSENEDADKRSTKVTLACSDGYRTTYEYVNVSQDAKAYVTLSDENILLTGADESATVTVESNYDWDFSYDTDDDWYTVTRDGDSLIITSTRDNETTEDYESTITVTAGDGAENVVEAQITVVEENIGNALILVYTITDGGTTVTLPLQGTVNCTVNWGDGTEDTVTSTKPTHTYDKTGSFNVVVKGTVTSLSHSGINSSSKVNTTLTAVRQWGNTGLTTATYAMYYCEGLTSIPDDTLGAFANVTKCTYMFEYCTALTTLPEGLFAYASKVTDFKYCFAYCSGLTEIPAGFFSKCTSADTFQYAFDYCSALTTIGEGVFDGCTAATSFYITFGYCESLKTIPEGIFSNNTAVTTFYGVFRNCSSLTSLPENLFANCSKSSTFAWAFYGDASLTSVPESTFAGCSAVTTYTYCFTGCSSLTTVPGNLFKDSPAAKTMSYVFKDAGLTTVPENLFANITAATTFAYCFSGCEALTSIPEALFSNNTAVTTFGYCFYNCSTLTSVPGGLFANNTGVNTFAETFYGCAALKEIGAGLFANNTGVTTFAMTFYGCASLTTIPSDLFANSSAVTTYASTFSNCSALTAIPENLFAGSKAAKTFTSTFAGCTALTGESAYDVLTVDGESVNVHLYKRSDYATTYTAPTAFGNCYDSCFGLSDYTSIPKTWGGGEAKDLSSVIGTYTAEGYTYSSSSMAAETTWTLKIYESSNSDYDVFIDGLIPYAAGQYPDTEAYIAQATYSNGQLVIPAQTTGYRVNNLYVGWYPCTLYVEGSGWSGSASVTDLTFTYDSATDTWTSDYGEFLAGFLYNNAIYSYFYAFLDVANPTITLKRTSTSTGISTQGVKKVADAAREISGNVVLHTEDLLSK